jgi:pimeloyl-ACP methyl ester carboxylesterase
MRLTELSIVRALVCVMLGLQLASAQPGGSALQTPRLDRIECPFERGAWAQNDSIECWQLIVPENRSRPSQALRLPVAVVHARQQTDQPPLVVVHGGPGLSGLTLMMRGMVASGMARDRDVVLYDQRGAGLSEPKLCLGFRVPLVTDYTTTGREEHRDQIRRCIESLRTRQIDPAAYNTLASANDLSDLRRALGYTRWDVYGESYGARLAQEAMRRDPGGIRAVVLSSPMIVGAGRAETPGSTERAFGRLFDACRSSLPCNGAFPRLADDFHQLFQDLERNPIAVPLDSGGATISLDGERMVELARRMLRTPTSIPLVPLIVHELRAGDRARAARELLRRGSRSRALPATLFLVDCYDQYGPDFDRLLDASRERASLPFRQQLDLECDLWQKRFADDSSRAPVRSDIPTLIVSGEFDPIVPPEWGRRIAATLSHAYVYVIPTESHEPPIPCRASIVRQFLANPLQRPDTSCIAGLGPIAFATQWPQ